MNKSSGFTFVAMLVVIALVSMGATVAYKAEPNRLEFAVRIQGEVVKRDASWRVKVMQMRTKNGTCMAEVSYYGGVPRIYVAVTLLAGERMDLGYLQINNGTEESLSDKALMQDFERAISERCLRFIIPGYAVI